MSPSPGDWLAVLAAGAVAAAPRLLGTCLVSDVGGRVVVRLTEVEAYTEADPASHSFQGATARNAVMFGPPGGLYVYFVYGMHWAANVSCGPRGAGEAVLLRAGRVVEGVELARRRRPTARRDVDLARGPARLAVAAGLDRAVQGIDLLATDSPVRLEPLTGPRGPESGGADESSTVRSVAGVSTGPRVGVSAAVDVCWRWWTTGDPTVSAYRAGGRRPRRRGDDPEPPRRRRSDDRLR